MLRLAILLCLFALSLLPAHAALQITSVSPSQASPGTLLTITGGPYTQDVRVLVGEETLQPETVSSRSLSVRVPDLPPGHYLLRLIEEDRISPESFSLQILEPTPQITELSPSSIEACNVGGAPEITVRGRGFIQGATLLLDGAGVPSEFHGSESITFAVPSLPAGQHQVLIVNPAGSRSLARGLQVDGTPVIDSIQQGTDNVTSYEVVIQGRNFLGASLVVVDGRRIPVAGMT